MEDKKELLDYLEENIRFFNNVDKKVFVLLKQNRLNVKDYAIVTPFLKQVVEYALVVDILEDEFDEINDIYDDLMKICEICNCCGLLLGILIDENCMHPTIENYINSLNGTLLREDIFLMLYSLIDKFTMLDDIEDYEKYEDYSYDLVCEEQRMEKLKYLTDLRNNISIIDDSTYELLDFTLKYILF